MTLNKLQENVLWCFLGQFGVGNNILKIITIRTTGNGLILAPKKMAANKKKMTEIMQFLKFFEADCVLNFKTNIKTNQT